MQVLWRSSPSVRVEPVEQYLEPYLIPAMFQGRPCTSNVFSTDARFIADGYWHGDC